MFLISWYLIQINKKKMYIITQLTKLKTNSFIPRFIDKYLKYKNLNYS